MDDTERAPAPVVVEPRPSVDHPAGSDSPVVDANRAWSTLNSPIAVALLVASVAAPYLKGLIAGLALAGAAAAVSDVLGAGRL